MEYAISPYLRALVEHAGSDLHLKAGSPPRIRISGELVALDAPAPSAQECELMILETMGVEVRELFLRDREADYAILLDGVGRFRANAFQARGAAGLVCRLIGARPLRLDELGLPEVVGQLALRPRGLVLVTGPTGSGKTTTLAAMVDLINENRSVHVLTIEDPIEILHEDKLASINQREIRTDTADFGRAMRAAMRQDPDVILIGEMRDTETVRAAIAAAETGHFVMSTLHTTDAAETIGRVIDYFPPDEQRQVRLSLAKSIQGVICQRLVPRMDGVGRLCGMEILVGTNRVSEAIADPDKTASITDILSEGSIYGMQTFDQHLVKLVMSGQITIAAAKTASSKPHNLTVQLKRAGLDPHLVDAA